LRALLDPGLIRVKHMRHFVKNNVAVRLSYTLELRTNCIVAEDYSKIREKARNLLLVNGVLFA
jgi:hypothetical protein